MAFELPIVSVLSGATPSQLLSWRTKGLLIPEIREKKPPIYSFRDLIVARSLAFLRGRTTSQKITRAIGNIRSMELTRGHLSQLRFGTDGDTIFIGTPDSDVATDVLRRPGQIEVFSFDDLAVAFRNFRDDEVASLEHPRPHLEVSPERLGGWPTIQGTRVPFDAVSDLLADGDIEASEVEQWYPGVSADAARDASDFAAAVARVTDVGDSEAA